jgi:hypothetical protein
MLFTFEFFRLREEDDAHATLDRITHSGTRGLCSKCLSHSSRCFDAITSTIEMIERKIGPSVIPAAVHVASSRVSGGETL